MGEFIRNVRLVSGSDAKKYLIPLLFFVLDGFGNGILYAVMLFVLVDLSQGSFSYEALGGYSLVILFSVFLRIVFQAAGLTLIQKFGPETSCRLRLELGDHIRSLNLGFFTKNSVGRLNGILATDIGDYETIITHCIGELVKVVMLIVIGLGFSLLIDWRMGLLSAGVILVALPLLIASGRTSAKAASRTRSAKQEANSRIIEYLNGIKTFRLYNLTGKRFSRLDDAFKNLRDASFKTETSVVPLAMSFSALSYLLVPLTLVVGAWLLSQGSLAPLAFLLVVLLGVSLSSALSTLSTLYPQIKGLNRASQSIIETRNTQPLPFTEQEFSPRSFDISCKDVTFSYTSEENVLHGINFTAPAGTTTALIGPSGSGKSTVASLVSRFWDVEDGKITIGGEDIREIAPDALNKHIATVFQDVYLLADTIKNNIKLGRPQATQAEVEAAARAAHCHEFILALDDGYETVVGEGGSSLSGGEKQRISIARALLKDAPIVILDESTSSLDADNEYEIECALDALMEGKTVLVIAHRLNTVRNAHNIIVLDKGLIREQGTHDELIAHKGWYAQVYKEQAEALNWRVGI